MMMNPINSTNFFFVKNHHFVSIIQPFTMTVTASNNGTTASNQWLYFRAGIGNGGPDVSSCNAISTKMFHIVGLHYNSTVFNFKLNGSTLSSWNVSTIFLSNSLSPNNFTLGAWNANGNFLYSNTDFQLSEMMFYNSRLTDSEIQAVEGYLGWKWGLRNKFPLNHPYYTAPPIVPGVFPEYVVSTLIVPPPTYVRTFLYNSTIQSFTVPADVTSLSVYLWGAGGGGGYVATGNGFTPGAGGAGAMVQGTLAVNPLSTLFIVVGKGGTFGGLASTEPQGAGGLGYYDSTSWTPVGNGNTGWGAGSGGGRSAIQLTSGGSDHVVAGGGGGGGVLS